MLSIKNVVNSKITWSIALLAVAGTAFFRSRLPKDSMLALQWPTNSLSVKVQSAKLPVTTNTSGKVEAPITTHSAKTREDLYLKDNIDLLNTTSAALSMFSGSYRTNDTAQHVTQVFNASDISNRLENIYALYTNVLMSGTLSTNEHKLVINVLDAHANVSALYLNPKNAPVLFAPTIATSPNGGITSITRASETLFHASLWLDTHASDRKKN
jgi:hypothetical protein